MCKKKGSFAHSCAGTVLIITKLFFIGVIITDFIANLFFVFMNPNTEIHIIIFCKLIDVHLIFRFITINNTNNSRQTFVKFVIRRWTFDYYMNSVHGKKSLIWTDLIRLRSHCVAAFHIIIKTKMIGKKCECYKDQNVPYDYVFYVLFCRDFWLVFHSIWSKYSVFIESLVARAMKSN